MVRIPTMNRLTKGVTLIELVVVLLIISILSTIAVGVYTQEIQRARIAKTRAEISSLSVAINRYQIDTGQFPPTGTGSSLAPNPINRNNPYAGSGYLQVALKASLNGNQSAPLSNRWIGPYFEFQENRLGLLGTGNTITASTSPAEIQFLDAWGNPFYFIQNEDYAALGGTFLPVTNPYRATETYFNPSTFQLISFGPNGTSDFSGNAVGTEADDLTNWRGSGF